MSDRDLWTVSAMKMYGGSFVQALAALAQRADRFNLQIIKDGWPDYWKDYEKAGVQMQAEDATN